MVTDIFNYYKYDDKLSAGGQPTTEQMEALKEDGVEVVISLSPTSTKNYIKEEAELMEKNGLQYIHFPVDCSKLVPEYYATFEGLMKGVEAKKTFVHCGGNIKSSNLIHMYKVINLGEDEAKSVSELKKIQTIEEKWTNFFKQFGMTGLS